MSQTLLILDGQTHAHYHTAEGKAMRLKAATLAFELKVCYPPCSEAHCQPVRELMATPEYTGRK